MTTDRIKARFQKVIGAIRKDRNGNFPKAMMTGQQMRKNTATVNCGGEWSSAEKSLAMAEEVIKDPRFTEFIEEVGASAKIEPNPFGGYQIRINY